MKKITVMLTTLLMSQFSQAALINDMQACQGLLDYLQQKLAKAPAHYDASKIKGIQMALKNYDDYIQDSIITPGLLEFNGGDQAKATAMQQQVDAYKQTITRGLLSRDSTGQLTSNHVISLNDCTKKAVPSGQELEDLKNAMNDIFTLAQSN